MLSEAESLAELALLLASERPAFPHGKVVSDAVTLRKLARRLSRAAEAECNGDRAPRGARQAESGVERIAAEYGIRCELSGDPRGYVVKLAFSNGASNELGGMWGVG
jgi:hypothetical protein